MPRGRQHADKDAARLPERKDATHVGHRAGLVDKGRPVFLKARLVWIEERQCGQTIHWTTIYLFP